MEAKLPTLPRSLDAQECLRIEERFTAAVPGPVCIVPIAGDRPRIESQGVINRTVCTLSLDDGIGSRQDGTFIVGCWDDVPNLLYTIRELREQLRFAVADAANIKKDRNLFLTELRRLVRLLLEDRGIDNRETWITAQMWDALVQLRKKWEKTP